MNIDIIVNDHSLQAQFGSLEEFTDSLSQYTFPVLKRIEALKIPLYKSYSIYEGRVTDQLSLIDILGIKNNPAVTLLKHHLIQVMCEEPYWQDSTQTNPDDDYEYCGRKLEAGCMTECNARKGILLSFECEEFKEDQINLLHNGQDVAIRNAYNINQFLWHGFIDGVWTAKQVFPYLQYEKRVTLLNYDGKIYTDEFLASKEIMAEDRKIIKEDISIMISDIIQGISSRFWKYVENTDSREFRTTISSNRECRIFFTYKNERITFFIGYIKKTKKIPKGILQQVKRLEKVIL